VPDMQKPLTRNIRPNREYVTLKEYVQSGGYQAVRRAVKELSPKEIQDEVKKANLRGRGGAGFNTGMKWGFVPMGDDAPSTKYLVANGDEMEPGTFKDRLLLEGDPHQLIDGMITSAYAIGANVGYIFLRWAYHLSLERVERAIAEAHDEGYLGKNILGSGFDFELHVHVSAGRYMCGEETGLLNALEGGRATPRAKPPYPQVSGLWGKPTIVQNIETLCNVPHIVVKGNEWYKQLSKTDDGGTKLYGVSGKVKNPGLWELPMGTTAREIIEEHAGGMRDGLTLRGFLPGGASTDFMMPEHLDTPMDFDHPTKAGSRLGTGTMIILDSRTCPVGLCANMEKFFAQESCGWCTPCRDGLPWIARTLTALEEGHGKEDDIDLMARQCGLLGPGFTFCALVPGAAEPLQSALKHFRKDFEEHVTKPGCPYR
jgi:NADH-quinone oxidoreductase subunit F